ncbi:Uncharacterised protein [Mycobacteroides abscessus subsp. abscessus]|nr:Uncharacterised protein [Mycobacteroides abscessus subsp. abscessus]
MRSPYRTSATNTGSTNCTSLASTVDSGASKGDSARCRGSRRSFSDDSSFSVNPVPTRPA